jgi:hypothetical protein
MPSRLRHTCQDGRCRMGDAAAPRLGPSRHFNRDPLAVALIAMALGACADAKDTPGGGAGSTGRDDGGAGPTRDGATESDAAPGAISEEEWKQKTSIYRGNHDIEAFPSRGCSTLPIGPEYGILPPVGCAWRSGSNSIRDCNAEPTCRKHADCATPLDRCRGAPSASCGYPGATPTPCASDAECTAVADGRCVAPPEPDVTYCYPTGRCEKWVARCEYRYEDCATDADCSSAPGGSCEKLINYARCEKQACLVDGDCTSGKRCACSDPANLCVPADCTTDADCPMGERCQLERGCFGTAKAYHCSTPSDTCREKADCTGGHCTFDGTFACRPLACPVPP